MTVIDRFSRIVQEIDEMFRELEEEMERFLKETFHGVFSEIEKRKEKILRDIEETVRKLRERGYRTHVTYREYHIVTGTEGTYIVPRYDIHERGDEVEIVVDLPGCEKDNVKVGYDEEHGRLVVTAKRADSSINYLLELYLPVDLGTIRATYRNGVLTIKARKRTAKLREVKVE